MIILVFIAWGMLAGWLASLILGGRQRPRSWVELIVAGLVGSLIGGLGAILLTNGGYGIGLIGIIGSIVGAVVVLAIWNLVRPPRKAPEKAPVHHRQKRKHPHH